MSDVQVAFGLGSLLWFLGGVGLVASLVTGAALFAPFAAVVVGLGLCYCIAGTLWLLRRENSGPGSARLPAR
jgi:hypothetical protein